MIAGISDPKTPAWALELADSIHDPVELLSLLHLPPIEAIPDDRFPLRVPRSYAKRMRPGNPRDPLFLQVWPDTRERAKVAGYTADPVGDRIASSTPGVLQKYAGRALLTITGACAVHCRYCFRRHFPYGEENPLGRHWGKTLQYLRDADDLREVILSGGDPLMLPDDRLAAIVRDLEQLPGLKRLRLHTRLPVVLPARVDPALCAWIADTRLKVTVVLHINHPQEIDSEISRACHALADAGAVLLNQSVLLRGVNDSASVLERLSEVLFAAGVLPYYLHLLDKVSGAAHFDLAGSKARRIYSELTARLPGYLVPRLVREHAGAASKTLIVPLPSRGSSVGLSDFA
ncbi:MAG: EF-P beta-lysylation protein EpmB [Acidiferrobacteraceae bacterium]